VTATNKSEATSAREADRLRVAKEARSKKTHKEPELHKKRRVKRTTVQTLPYERFVSDYIILLKSNVKIGKQTANLYSRTYVMSDTNYSSLTEEEQINKLKCYMEMLNGFDSSSGVQITLHNTQVNAREFAASVLLERKNDGLDAQRDELNVILRDKLMLGQNGVQCKKYITVTVLAVNFEAANKQFLNYEMHMNVCAGKLGTELYPLKANSRVRILADIFCGVESELSPIGRDEFARSAEKLLCCPDYFEFKKDYFMYNDKYARCVYFQRLPGSDIEDTIFKDILETNQTMLISKNIEFIETEDALERVRRQLTSMKAEELSRTRAAAERSRGAFIDPIEGTSLAENKAHAKELLEGLQDRNQKMMQVQFLIMLIASSYEELEHNTENIQIIARKHQIKLSNAPYRQEQAMSSVLPLGNSISADREYNIQVRRTLSTESTAVFCPFNAREYVHKGGLYYGVNQITRSLILFDRRRLSNPNGFIFGVPGAGKGVTAKIEMIYSILATDDEILILDPEREYTALAELFGGEVIHISEGSKTYINPLDLTPNPDPTDAEYDPVTAKLEFLMSFFSSILGNVEIEATQKTIIDTVMRETYKNHKSPTLVEYYAELEKLEKEGGGELEHTASRLRQALHLYVHGSMNVFSKPSNVNIHKRIVVYDIKNLGKNLQTMGMMIVLENIWGRIAKNRVKSLGTRVYIDEMYLMFKSEQCAEFFRMLYKRARKWGGIPTGITQNVDDLLQSKSARTMLSNTKFIIMLSQNATDSEVLSEILKIPTETMDYVTNSGIGRGLLYAGEYGNIPFDNRFPTDTKLYRIISTKFGEDLQAEAQT
jgi:hypothetical protein